MLHSPSARHHSTQPASLSRRGFLSAAGAVGVGAAALAGATTAHADADLAPSGRRRLVTTPAELEAAFAGAEPGDVIMMKNGTWRDVGIEFRAKGSADRPIILRAQTPGKVIISGTSYLKIVGDHLVVDGLTFRDGAAPLNHLHLIQFSDWDEAAEPGTVTQYSNHCRLTNVVVDRFNKEQVLPAGKDVWVGLWGTHNRIDHCAFLNKTSYALLIIGWRPEGVPDHHRIDNNYFSDIPNNGYSAAAVVIRLGDGVNALEPAHSVIERNVFENMEGIGRIVSLKCSNSTIRDNTFWRASGAICSRSGSFNTVERNFIFEGMDTNDGYYTGGMLMIGEGHVIRGNYVQGCTARGKAALQLYAGDPNNGPGVGTYYPTKDVVVENNTFVDNAKNIIVNMYYSEEKGWTIPVENITYRENAIVGNDSPSPVIDEVEVPPIGDIIYEGNQFFGGNLEGLTDTPGIEITDPGLVEQPDGTYEYLPHSQLRHNIATRPLTKADVGPEWGWR
ncbi:polysaccharide lyase 6 family protein [Microlunatus sp. Y2014]|uniref:polysaccharide lyase 6 family protein n=1 Tax=Microlunatus sp. Y2014 TaxID=3418488 RepID=UPI003DA6D160